MAAKYHLKFLNIHLLNMAVNLHCTWENKAENFLPPFFQPTHPQYKGVEVPQYLQCYLQKIYY